MIGVLAHMDGSLRDLLDVPGRWGSRARWRAPGATALWVALALLVSAALPGAGGAIPARADGNGSLGPALRVAQAGGYATGGVGFCPGGNCSGSGAVTLSGVPAGSAATRALIYWVTIQGTASGVPLPRLDA